MVFLIVVSVGCVAGAVSGLYRGVSYFIEWEILRLNGVSVVGACVLDWMSMMFMSFVAFISSMVLYYRGGYMRGDRNVNRFLYLVLGFVMSMGFLIISPNLVRILLGWDGLGLISYALVIYYQNEKRARAGMLTALSNRVGDVAILIGVSLMFRSGGWNFLLWGGGLSPALVCYVVLAAITKRAQIPFSAWLPAAMAAPTPVSALVHSSTLVTAGVYLLIRFRPMLEGTFAQRGLLVLASLTMFMAGLGANFETDLKKIIALSTLRQLGVIMTILSLGWRELAFFHLLAHALFKALLFMRAGSIIHRVGDYQDIRVMGRLVGYMPLRVMRINLANLALCGTPFLAGFYSKDLILEVAFINELNGACFWLLVVSTGLTVCYTFRLVYFRLSGDYNLASGSLVSDEDWVMTGPIIALGVGAIGGGCLLSWLIFPSPSMICMSLEFKLLALAVRGLGGFVGYTLNIIVVNYSLASLTSYGAVVFSGSMWFIPFISTRGVRGAPLSVGQKYQQHVDGGWSEYYGGQGSFGLFRRASSRMQLIQDNSIKVYIMVVVMWVLALILLSL